MHTQMYGWEKMNESQIEAQPTLFLVSILGDFSFDKVTNKPNQVNGVRWLTRCVWLTLLTERREGKKSKSWQEMMSTNCSSCLTVVSVCWAKELPAQEGERFISHLIKSVIFTHSYPVTHIHNIPYWLSWFAWITNRVIHLVTDWLKKCIHENERQTISRFHCQVSPTIWENQD